MRIRNHDEEIRLNWSELLQALHAKHIEFL